MTEHTAQHFAARLERLLKMCAEPNWGYGGEQPISPAIVSRVDSITRSLVAAGLPWPYVFPLDDGGVIIEWDRGSWSVSLEFMTDEIEGDATDLEWHRTDDFQLPAACSDNAVIDAMLRLARETAWPEIGQETP